MNPGFPLPDVNLEITAVRRVVSDPFFRNDFYCLNQNEFSMDVPGVGWFYAAQGDYISVVPAGGADPASIGLYLNGSVYGAILHQRKILPLHGSCFRFNGSGIMVCGDTGSGKSTLTASFCLNGAGFLTDDVSPLLFKGGKPYIWALSDRIKLWSDALKQLAQNEEGLPRVDPGMEKYYYPMETPGGNTVSLDRIYILEVTGSDRVVFEELSGPLKFSALRGEIYRSEYLPGMPENEQVYFVNIVDICNSVEIFRLKRPEGIRVAGLMEAVKKHMSREDV